MKLNLPRKRRNIWPFLGFGVLVALANQFIRGEYPTDANSIGNLLGGVFGGVILGWIAFLITERFYPKP